MSVQLSFPFCKALCSGEPERISRTRICAVACAIILILSGILVQSPYFVMNVVSWSMIAAGTLLFFASTVQCHRIHTGN